MVYKCPFDISVICLVLGLPYNKFYRWFKDCLSDFKTQEGQFRLHQHDFSVPIKNGSKEILVPIFRPEQIASHMAIDEKHINGEFYTGLTNGKTGKVALLCSTIKAKELEICLQKFGSLLHKVNYLSLDLSPTFELVATKNFPNATQIADKFHVIKNGLEHLQAIRIRLKQEELKKQRNQQSSHEELYRESKNDKLIEPKMKCQKLFIPTGFQMVKLSRNCLQEAGIYLC